MKNVKGYIEIKNEKIPLVIKKYKNSKSVKLYFREDVLYINKAVYISDEEILEVISKNEEKIYTEYMKRKRNPSRYFRTWNTGDRFLYKGKDFVIERIADSSKENNVEVEILEKEKKIKIYVPAKISEENKEKINECIKKCVKELLRNNLKVIISERIEYFSKLMNIEYNSFKITDATTRFGSCFPSKQTLNFTLRLMMLDTEKIDAVIVHELCHIIHQNHSKEFYELVEKYVPSYFEIDKWLKKNSYRLML